MNRELPRESEAEDAVAGGVMLNASALDEIQPMISSADFYQPFNAQVFAAAVELRQVGEPCDLVTVAKKLVKVFPSEELLSVRLEGLAAAVPHTAHIRHYAEMVVAASRRRKVIRVAEEAIEAAYGNAETSEIVADAETKLHALLEADAGSDAVTIREALEDVFSLMERGEPAGVPMGWGKLNELYQLQPGNLIYIAARPSMGKTGLAANIAINVARTGRKCFLFSLEQSRVEMAGRLLSAWSQVAGTKINRMDSITDSERRKLLREATDLSELSIGIDDDVDTTVSKIAAKSRLWKRRHGLDLLVVDYLQLIEPEDRKVNREQQVAVMSRGLKKLAGQLEIPVVVLAQLNRQSESRSDRRPQLSDLRESGSLEQDANCVILIHRPEFYDENARPGEADLIVAKNRNGRTGVVSLQFEKSTITFRDLAHEQYGLF